jgi:hypothetical protein
VSVQSTSNPRGSSISISSKSSGVQPAQWTEENSANSTQQRAARSSNKQSSQGSASNQHLQSHHSPWTPERTHQNILVKSTAQLPKKTLLNLNASASQNIP